MANANNGMSTVLVGKLADWLMSKALASAELEEIVSGCCERLAASGLPLARAHLSFSVLHPLYSAMGFTWRRGESLEIEGYRHVEVDEDDRFLKSPYFHILSHGLDHLRCHLESGTNFKFPIFDDLKKQGVTDYLAFVTEFETGSGQGMVGSWSTDREGGFTEDEISELLRIQTRLAVVCKIAVQGGLARNMLSTYLGSGAGSRVLSGQIRRGDGETTRAAIIIADIRNSTLLAEKLGREGYIEVLNTFFDTVAGTFAQAGGEILSFLGDGFLAIVPCGRNMAASSQACTKVYEAAMLSLRRMKHVNAVRAENDKDEIGFGIGLHIGNVMFGNVGMEDRLTFSVFGSAVNEASRLEALTKKYNAPVVASQAFADYCTTEWNSLGAETLRGIGEPMNVYAPAKKIPDRCDRDAKWPEKRSRRSDAENVVLLHREGPRKAS